MKNHFFVFFLFFSFLVCNFSVFAEEATWTISNLDTEGQIEIKGKNFTTGKNGAKTAGLHVKLYLNSKLIRSADKKHQSYTVEMQDNGTFQYKSPKDLKIKDKDRISIIVLQYEEDGSNWGNKKTEIKIVEAKKEIASEKISFESIKFNQYRLKGLGFTKGINAEHNYLYKIYKVNFEKEDLIGEGKIENGSFSHDTKVGSLSYGSLIKLQVLEYSKKGKDGHKTLNGRIE